MKVIDKSTNELEYVSDNPIIYLSDFSFKETKIYKGKKVTEFYEMKNQLYCNLKDEDTNNYRMKRFRSEFNIKPDSEFEILQIILNKKIGYSNIK